MLDHRTRVACSQQNYVYFSLLSHCLPFTILLFLVVFWFNKRNTYSVFRDSAIPEKSILSKAEKPSQSGHGSLRCFSITAHTFQISEDQSRQSSWKIRKHSEGNDGYGALVNTYPNKECDCRARTSPYTHAT